MAYKLRGLGDVEIVDSIFNDDGTVLYLFSDGTGILTNADGTVGLFIDADGTVTDPATLYSSGGVSSSGTDWKGIITTATGFVTTAQTAINTQKLIDLNRTRAAQGLAPISGSQIAPTVNVGVSPEIQKMLMIGGAGVALIMLLKKSK